MKDILINGWEEITYSLRDLCGRPTPMKRFIAVLIIGGIFSIVSIYTLVSSIYNIGKHDAQKEFMKLQHIETLKLQPKQDSINILNSKDYEYEQQSDDRREQTQTVQ